MPKHKIEAFSGQEAVRKVSKLCPNEVVVGVNEVRPQKKKYIVYTERRKYKRRKK